MQSAVSAKVWLLAVAGLAVLCGTFLAWSLDESFSPRYSSLVRGLGDLATATVLGLTMLPILEEQARKTKLLTKVWRLTSVFSAIWALCESLLLHLNAADNLGLDTAEVTISHIIKYIGNTSTGRINALIILCTSLIALFAALAFKQRKQWSTAPYLAATCICAIALPLTGHLSQFAFGSLLISAHVLAVSLWCGTLIAITLTASGRGDWARLLPKYSRLALQCVGVLSLTGVLSALLILDSPLELATSGYGRIIFAKTVLLLMLIALAWQYQKYWLSIARSHHVTANASFVRAGIEIGLMSVVLGLAATLSTTG
ncbi:MAG: copper resistance D family protein [Mycobacteriaceae bacterium]